KLVGSVRGPGGGYCLTKPMSEVSVVDIILAVDEPIDATQCGGKENCYNDQRCMTHDLWASLNARIRDYLALVTLEQLVASPKVKDIAVLQDMRACKSEEEAALA
ncbi:MAG: Rrf2 family transcriptional regulator, partial [Nitrosospira sp.]|nr:Rrf2 family transcriptional regulator [Nitrosospira sp.]